MRTGGGSGGGGVVGGGQGHSFAWLTSIRTPWVPGWLLNLQAAGAQEGKARVLGPSAGGLRGPAGRGARPRGAPTVSPCGCRGRCRARLGGRRLPQAPRGRKDAGLPLRLGEAGAHLPGVLSHYFDLKGQLVASTVQMRKWRTRSSSSAHLQRIRTRTPPGSPRTFPVAGDRDSACLSPAHLVATP